MMVYGSPDTLHLADRSQKIVKADTFVILRGFLPTFVVEVYEFSSSPFQIIEIRNVGRRILRKYYSVRVDSPARRLPLRSSLQKEQAIV